LLKYNSQIFSEHPNINLQNNPSYPNKTKLERLPESEKEITPSIQEINNYLLSAAQTHSKDIENEVGRLIYIIRKGEIERSRRYRKFDRYSSANLKYLRIYGRQYNN
jgi:hypothetical protein